MQDRPGVRWFGVVLGAVIVMGLIIGAVAISQERSRISILEYGLHESLRPLEGVISTAAGWVQARVEGLQQLRQMVETNQQLQERLDQLNALVVENEELRQENERLKGIFALRDQIAPHLWEKGILARVVGRNPDNWFRYVELDQGLNDGVSMDMLALTSHGLVGRVIQVGSRTSRVMLFSDPDSALGVRVQRADSREAGVLEGIPGYEQEALLRFFTREADVVVGDRIVTSGLGSRFPPGLPVGIVEEVGSDSFGLIRTARVRLLADLSRLEEVFLVGGRGGS